MNHLLVRNRSLEKLLDNEINWKNSLDMITGDILKSFKTALKLLIKNQYLNGVSLIKCNNIPIEAKFWLWIRCNYTNEWQIWRRNRSIAE
jgi:hypothetical protein